MEKRENEVRKSARFRMSVRIIVMTLDAANVKVVDEEMMIEELRNGRMGERPEARHLM